MEWLLPFGIILIAVAVFITIYTYYDYKVQRFEEEIKAYTEQYNITEEDSP